MAPKAETLVSTFPRNDYRKPLALPMEGLQRAVSDLSFQLSKEAVDTTSLPPISEVENAKCECCGMCEECTLEYIQRVRDKFCGKWICGLCAEAVKEEVNKRGGCGGEEEALSAHMSACKRFNRIERAYPVLYQAEAMRELLKKSSMTEGGIFRAKSNSPRDRVSSKKGGIMRSSSCIPAITRELVNDPSKPPN